MKVLLSKSLLIPGICFFLLVAIGICVFLPGWHMGAAVAQTAATNSIVSIAQDIQYGRRGTGRNPDTCVSLQLVECVEYSWGAGHGNQPGISTGTCKSYTGPSPCKANTMQGLDCSGLTRWVYFLYYGKDVLGSGNTTSQTKKLTSTTSPQAGDLVFFAHKGGLIFHVGIVVDTKQMISSPRTGTFVRQDSIASFAVRGDYVSGYFRYVDPNVTKTPKAQGIPKLQMDYMYGSRVNKTLGITNTTFAVWSIVEDTTTGKITGIADVSGLDSGSITFTGVVQADGSISFHNTPNDSDDCGTNCVVTYTGMVDMQTNTMSGTFIATGVQNDQYPTQMGTWTVSSMKPVIH